MGFRVIHIGFIIANMPWNSKRKIIIPRRFESCAEKLIWTGAPDNKTIDKNDGL